MRSYRNTILLLLTFLFTFLFVGAISNSSYAQSCSGSGTARRCNGWCVEPYGSVPYCDDSCTTVTQSCQPRNGTCQYASNFTYECNVFRTPDGDWACNVDNGIVALYGSCSTSSSGGGTCSEDTTNHGGNFAGSA